MLLLGLACDVVRLRRVKRDAVPLGSVAVRGARIGLSATVTTPTAIGYLHPAVVLPDGFRARVDEREWDAVVAHECAHLARGDDWAKAIQSAILRIGWWIPGLWLLSRALDLERELASDERAAGETGPRRYAACLLRLATDRADAVAPGALGTPLARRDPGRAAHPAHRAGRARRCAPRRWAPSPPPRSASSRRPCSRCRAPRRAPPSPSRSAPTPPSRTRRRAMRRRASPSMSAARSARRTRRPWPMRRRPPPHPLAAAAPAALPVRERSASSERPAQHIIATVARRAVSHAPADLPSRGESRPPGAVDPAGGRPHRDARVRRAAPQVPHLLRPAALARRHPRSVGVLARQDRRERRRGRGGDRRRRRRLGPGRLGLRADLLPLAGPHPRSVDRPAGGSSSWDLALY